MRNPKLMTLMFAGCKVIYPSGYFLQGLPDDRFIRTGVAGIHGDESEDELHVLSEEGLEAAITAQENFEDGDHDDKELAWSLQQTEMQ